MSFYGGRPGQSFTISRVFKNFVEMYDEAVNSGSVSELYYESRVPVGSFALIAYGLGSSGNLNSSYEQNRQEELNWFSDPNCPVEPIQITTTNTIENNDYNGTVWIKCYDTKNKSYYYSYITNVAGIFPQIANGQWTIGGVNTGIRAEGRQVEFKAFYDEKLATYAFLTYTPSNDTTPLSDEEVRPAQFGLSNLTDRFIFNTMTNSYEQDENGEYILVYEADKNGRYQYNEDGSWKELGYFTLNDWDSINYPLETNFFSDKLRWKYEDEEQWRDLFDITDLTNIKTYMLSSLEAAQSAENTQENIEDIKIEVDDAKQIILDKAEETAEWIGEAQSAAEKAKTAVDEFTAFINDLPPGSITDVTYLASLIESAKGNFTSIDQRLDTMPYQFNLIKDMRACTSLERGDKAFTFGKDQVGDDDSKLFQIFDPNNFEEDKNRLEETDEALISVYNPLGLKIDETYNIGTTGLVAGKLTVFSGKGSGGGGGGTIPTLSSSLTSVTVQSGQTVTIDWYWTSANGGNGTIYIKDSMSNAAIVDVADPNKNFTAGVVTKRGTTESFVWKPANGVHKLVMYVVDGGGIPTNNIEIEVIVGGLAYTGTPTDGLNYSTDAVITLSYKFSTIYKNDKVVLHYDVYNNNVLRADLSGEKESDFASGNQTVSITLKNRSDNIGSGVFKVVTYAYMKSNPDVQTNQLTRNFIIAEANKIYLTTTFDTTSTEVYANKPFFIPLILTYAGGSTFTIVGKYSDQPGVTWETGLDLGIAEDVTSGKTTQFSARFSEPGTYYLKFYASGVGISATGESEEIVVEVGAENKQYLLQRQGDLLLNLSADEGQTNKSNRGVWENTVIAAGEQVYRCNLTDFNYYANGWSTDSNGIPEGWLLFNSKAYGRVIAPILEKTRIPQNGFTLECVFKANDIGVDAPILDWTIGGISGKGFYIYKDRAFINLPEAGIKNLVVYYEPHGISMDSEAIHIAFVLDAENKYAKIYLNGVLSGASELIYGDLTDGKYASFSNIYLNCNNTNDLSKIIYGNCKIAAIRLYSDVLESDELVKNYIYNLQDEILQRSLWGKAGFTEKEGVEVQLAPTDGSVPYMKFYLTKRNWEIMTKDEKVPVRIEYYEKGSTTPITWYNVKTSWQGTSSIAYPVKNFKLKLDKDLEGNKQKYKLDKDYGKKENTFCLKADYMDPSHIHNTGNANFIHDSGIFSKYTLTAAQASECGLGPDVKWVLPAEKAPKSLATRTTIYGYPILLFICLESEETADLTADELAEKNPATVELKIQLDAQAEKIASFKNVPEESLTEDQKADIAYYNELKASYESAKAQNNINLRIYEPDKFWGIYNFNLDKGSNDSWGLYREDDYENYDMSDCTSFEVAANSAYSAGGFRALKFVKKIGKEDYAWTRPYVYFDLNGNVDNVNQKHWSITRCNADGSMNNSIVRLTDTFNGNRYTGYYNKKLQISGYVRDGIRYSYNTSTGLYNEDPAGTYIKLYEMDGAPHFNLKVVDGALVPYEGYFEYNEADWSLDVAVTYTEIVDLTEWEIVSELPANKDYYYNYYITDLELRFPDMDVYLFNDNGKEKYNKLMYKEYDKIIALVDYVDSYRNANDINADGTTFLNTLSNHFDKDGLMNYYLFVMAVGLIDNFGKNMMMDTWGLDKNHQRPYRTTEIDGVTYHQVYRYLGTWDEDEEYYTGIDDFEYGLLDISNVTEDEEGKKHFKIYPCDSNYTSPDLTADFIDVTATNGIANELIWDDVIDGDDQKMGWIHEIHEDKLVWCPHCYDLDSCLSSDNSGNLVFTPSIEMEDKSYVLATNETEIVMAAPFNTSSSSLWSKVSNGLHAELGKRFIELQNNILTTDNFYTNYYTNAIEVLGQRWYNGDAIPKYLSRENIKVVINNQEQLRQPIEFINLARGDDWQRTYKWLRHRLAYLGSMYDRDNTENYSSGMELRCAVQGVKYGFELELYEPMYMKIVGKNNQGSWARANKYNDKIIIDVTSSNDAADQEVYILPANNIKTFKERSNYGFSSFKQASANRLLEVNFEGSKVLKSWYYDTSFNPENNRIQKINLNGCSALDAGSAIDGSKYPLLKEIDIRNSSATFNFNNGNGTTDEGGGIINTAYLNYNTSSLSIRNHFELENLLVQLKYDNGIQNEDMVQSGHSTPIGLIDIQNCPNVNISFEYLIQNGSTYTPPNNTEQRYINSFIDKVGPYALFQGITSFVISNSLPIEPNEDGVKELKLSLSQANLISINGCDITKITFIANKYNLFGTTLYASYPGKGGETSISDSDYQSSGADGLNCDENITEIEIRNIPGSITEFRFPWRVHLGTLNKLEKLLFNVNSINPKLYNQDSFNEIKSAEDLGITGKEYVAPKRFELILPSSDTNPNFKQLYINPTVSEVNFTCVRQPEMIKDYYISSAIPSALKKNLVNRVNHFSGIDIKGYSSLIINFKGFKKITGILGMNSISVVNIANEYGPEAFEQYFGDCYELSELYAFEAGANKKWNFEEWSSGEKARKFTTLSRMFNNCYKLKNDYVQGWRRLIADNLTDTSYMFNNCRAIESINWEWSTPILQTIAGMFSHCYNSDTATGLSSAVIKFNEGESLTDISQVFKGCKNLKINVNSDLPIQIYDKDSRLNTSNIIAMDELFYDCASITGISFRDQYGGEEEWDFSALQTASNLFGKCENLKEVKFPDKANFTKAINLSSMFQGCSKLEAVFQNENGNQPVLYDKNVLKEPLTLKNLFANCSSLQNISSFALVDMTRVNDFSGMFSGNTNLRGSESSGNMENNILNLEQWKIDENLLIKNMSDMFFGCASLKGVTFPSLEAGIQNVASIDRMFKNCRALQEIDISSLKLVSINSQGNISSSSPKSLTGVFQDCQQLSSINGYETWNVTDTIDFSYLFAGCAAINSIDLSNWRLAAAKKLQHMFASCSRLETIIGLRDIVNNADSSLNQNIALENVKFMFEGCQNLIFNDDNNCNLKHWQYALSTVDSFECMFKGCKKLQNINDLFFKQSSFTNPIYVGAVQFKNLTSFKEMFAGCTALEVIDYFNSTFDMSGSKLSTMLGMAHGCTNLKTLSFTPKGGTFEYIDSNGLESFVDGCSNLTNITLITGSTLKYGIDLEGIPNYPNWERLLTHLAGEEVNGKIIGVCYRFKEGEADISLNKGVLFLPRSVDEALAKDFQRKTNWIVPILND